MRQKYPSKVSSSTQKMNIISSVKKLAVNSSRINSSKIIILDSFNHSMKIVFANYDLLIMYVWCKIIDRSDFFIADKININMTKDNS